jgi:hypothetical protein
VSQEATGSCGRATRGDNKNSKSKSRSLGWISSLSAAAGPSSSPSLTPPATQKKTELRRDSCAHQSASCYLLPSELLLMECQAGRSSWTGGEGRRWGYSWEDGCSASENSPEVKPSELLIGNMVLWRR